MMGKHGGIYIYYTNLVTLLLKVRCKQHILALACAFKPDHFLLSRNIKERTFGQVRPTKIKISLCIRAV